MQALFGSALILRGMGRYNKLTHHLECVWSLSGYGRQEIRERAAEPIVSIVSHESEDELSRDGSGNREESFDSDPGT